GLPLTFARSFSQPITGRYQLGLLGRGWTSNWDVSATVDNMGTVFIRQGPTVREFMPKKDGSYQAVGTDTGTLTHDSNGVRLTEAGGAVLAFLPDGRPVFLQDPHGARITAGYNGTRLTSLTHSDGQQLLLSYNGQGSLSQVTAPAGRVATYTYDTSG